MYKIGVLGRHNKEFKDYHITTDLEKIILNYGCYPLMIMPTFSLKDSLEIIDLCDGVIIPGGVDYNDFDVELVKYLYEKNVPTLGICLGCQMMGKAFNGEIDFIESTIIDHKIKDSYVHKVNVLSSKLGEILDDDSIMVNSIHRKYIKKTDLKINAVSEDGIIEGVEDSNKKFFIGVQWHPEMMVNYDEFSKKIFRSFFEAISGNKL